MFSCSKYTNANYVSGKTTYVSTSGLVNWLGFKSVAQKMINERDLFLPIEERIIAKLK